MKIDPYQPEDEYSRSLQNDHAQRITMPDLAMAACRSTFGKLAIAALCAGAIAGAIWKSLH